MSEIIPILELVPVDDADCKGCYWLCMEREVCTQRENGIKGLECPAGGGWKIWKEVTK